MSAVESYFWIVLDTADNGNNLTIWWWGWIFAMFISGRISLFVLN
jgi:hypothetical protein